MHYLFARIPFKFRGPGGLGAKTKGQPASEVHILDAGRHYTQHILLVHRRTLLLTVYCYLPAEARPWMVTQTIIIIQEKTLECLSHLSFGLRYQGLGACLIEIMLDSNLITELDRY